MPQAVLVPSPNLVVYETIPMGHLDQLAKQTFAEETESITGGAVV